jgi:hypothetical protein
MQEATNVGGKTIVFQIVYDYSGACDASCWGHPDLGAASPGKERRSG